MKEEFVSMLSGGHPNSLGRTEEVVVFVLADRAEMDALFKCYFCDDEIVRLRVSSAMKRVAIAKPEWVIDYMDRLQNEVAAIDQASNQWTLPLLFDLTKSFQSATQKHRAIEIMQNNLSHHKDWIVLNNTMQVLFEWSEEDAPLRSWLITHLKRLKNETRKSVAGRAQKLLAKI